MRQHTLRRAGRHAGLALLDFLLPTRCFVCDALLPPLALRGACASCWAALCPVAPDACPGCALAGPSDLLGPAGDRCADCRMAPPPFDTVRAAVVYDDAARAIVLRAKDGRSRELYRELARMMEATLRVAAPELAGIPIVPVPSHPWNDLVRGYSPAGEIARRLRASSGCPRFALLSRRWRSPRNTKRLSGVSRRALADRGIRLRAPLAVRRLVLVDDVMTTGATLGACARVLRAAGAEEIHALVWARTPRKAAGS
ncbi:MAG TPA: ComF family protein [Candidatus Polarisedimenticolaceae bacterium]|nr:ComF family protein [Candidatus Polarisedimenticolaceae bacterium]